MKIFTAPEKVRFYSVHVHDKATDKIFCTETQKQNSTRLLTTQIGQFQLAKLVALNDFRK